MKITHISLCGAVTDNWLFQENLLSKYHRKIGHDVTIIASHWVSNEKGMMTYFDKSDYINDDGIKMIRLQLKGKNNFNKKIKRYNGLFDAICKTEPDIIFVHGCQFIDIKIVAKYASNYANVKIYVDNHADFSNSARNFFSKNVLNKILWRHCAHLILRYATKFYGVTPARVDFVKKIYKIPENKVELLVMGVDDEKAQEANNIIIKNEIREKHNINSNDFLIITGGKINNHKKQTILLMEAVKQINNDNIKLIVFGSVSSDLKEKVNNLLDGSIVQYIGWVKPSDTYKYFGASDLAVFPGRHSVFWEQVTGMGIPMIVKYWDNTTHIDLGGNVKFLYEDSVDEIKNKISEICFDKAAYGKMKETAVNEGMRVFSYENIAKKSIE